MKPINIIKWYQKYDTGLIRYLFISPVLIALIISPELCHEDLSCPIIIDKKIKTISSLNSKFFIVVYPFSSKIKSPKNQKQIVEKLHFWTFFDSFPIHYDSLRFNLIHKLFIWIRKCFDSKPKTKKRIHMNQKKKKMNWNELILS